MIFLLSLRRNIFLSLGLFLFALGNPLCVAQVEEARDAIENPGFALVKPQSWSSERQANVLEFLAYANRSGYYVFRTVNSPNHQVATSKIVKVVIYPGDTASLSTGEQRAALQKTLEEYAALAKKFPIVAGLLEKASASLKADIAKYDAGSVKEGGQWIPRKSYFQQKAVEIAKQLRDELTAAPKIKEVDLAAHPYYLSLQDLVSSEPSTSGVLEGVRSLYQSLVRKADREALLGRLNSPAIGYEEAVELVKQLKALQPDEDARSNLYVQGWDAAVARAGELTGQITEVQAQFEAAMPGEAATVPTLPPELVSNLDKLSEAVKAFRAGSPPSAIRVPLLLADAMMACEKKFPGLATQIQKRDYLDAKLVLDPLSNQADIIGQKTSKVLSDVRKKLTKDIESYQSLRNEGKMLADNDKIEEALKKYQQAYAIIPSKELGVEIDNLKKQ